MFGCRDSSLVLKSTLLIEQRYLGSHQRLMGRNYRIRFHVQTRKTFAAFRDAHTWCDFPKQVKSKGPDAKCLLMNH